jgi:hypothetical protein
MKKSSWTLPLACVVVSSSLLVVPDVYAQFGGGMGSGMGGARHGERPGKGCDDGKAAEAGKRGPGQPPEMLSREQLEYRLSTLQVDLRLSPEQSGAWQAFADRVLALESDLSRKRAQPAAASAQPAAVGAVKSVANAVDQTRNRLTALEDIETATRALYQTLQPDQRTMADLRMAEFLGPLLRS